MAKQFVMQTSHREKNVLFEGRESIDRFWPNKHLTMDILVYVNARPHIRTRKNSLTRVFAY